MLQILRRAILSIRPQDPVPSGNQVCSYIIDLTQFVLHHQPIRTGCKNDPNLMFTSSLLTALQLWRSGSA